MENAVAELLCEVKRVYKEKHYLTEELLSALHFLFQAPLEQALDLVDRNHVTLMTSPSGRQIYQVLGSTGNPYMCFKDADYCGCPAYKFSVLKRKDALWCKHLLAIKLSVAMETLVERTISDKELATAIATID